MSDENLHRRKGDNDRSSVVIAFGDRSLRLHGLIVILAFFALVGTVAVPIYLAWSGSGSANAGDAKDVQRAMERNSKAIEDHRAHTEQLLQDHKAQTDQVIQLLRDTLQVQKENQAIGRRTCRGVSKSEEAKEACDK